MPLTSKNLRYPSPGAAPNVAQDIQNLAADVNTALPGAWVYQIRNTAFTTTPSGTTTMATLPTATFSVVVPTGRTLDVEFKVPRIGMGASGEAKFQLVVGGVVEQYVHYSAGTSSMYLTLFMSGSIVGTGASVTVNVQGCSPVGATTIDGGGAGSGAPGPVILRYRIV